MLLDYKKEAENLEALVRNGLLRKSEWDGLVLYTYTDHCSYQKHWNELTVESRGTIYNKENGAIVAAAFHKFFNLGEIEGSCFSDLPNTTFSVQEKMDGVLGIIYMHKGKWYIATRGSFYSEFVPVGQAMLDELNMGRWNHNYTPLVEIIHPKSKILVEYPEERTGLYLIGARSRFDGSYLSQKQLDTLAGDCGFKRPKYYRSDNPHYVEALLERAKNSENFDGDEGWVVEYHPSGFRVKIKHKRYLELARMKTHTGLLPIWEKLRDNKVKEFLEHVPEELREEAEQNFRKLAQQARNIQVEAEMLYREMELGKAVESEGRKAAAQLIKAHPDSRVKALLFCILSGDYAKMKSHIDKLIRPTNGELVDTSELLGKFLYNPRETGNETSTADYDASKRN